MTNYKESSMALGIVKVFGLNQSVTNVSVNGKAFSNFLYNIPDHVCVWFYVVIPIGRWISFVY